MDNKVIIKEEYILSDDIASQNQQELFHEVVTMNTNSDDVPIKTEILSETPFAKHLVKDNMSESVTCNNNWEIHCKTENEQQTIISDFSPQKEAHFHTEDSVMKDKKYESKHDMEYKIEIKEEPWYLEIETSSDDNKEGNFSPVKSSRLPSEPVLDDSDKSPLTSAELSGRDTTSCNGMDHLEFECLRSTTDSLSVEEYVHSEQTGKFSDEGGRCIHPLCSKQICLHHKGKDLQKCNIYAKNFNCISELKINNLIHESKVAYKCKTCNKSFTRLSDLKRHNLTHEGKKPYECKTCNKRFTRLSTLKRHNLTHEGKKAYQCNTCSRSFIRLSHLKTHSFIHESKKPYQCKTCNKGFTQLSTLKMHNLIHEGTKPYQCKTCHKSFTQLCNLKSHTLIHEGKRPYLCKTCNKRFTRLSTLKRHTLTHEATKPH